MPSWGGISSASANWILSSIFTTSSWGDPCNPANSGAICANWISLSVSSGITWSGCPNTSDCSGPISAVSKIISSWSGILTSSFVCKGFPEDKLSVGAMIFCAISTWSASLNSCSGPPLTCSSVGASAMSCCSVLVSARTTSSPVSSNGDPATSAISGPIISSSVWIKFAWSDKPSDGLLSNTTSSGPISWLSFWLISGWSSMNSILFSSATLKTSVSSGAISILSSLLSTVAWSRLSTPCSGDPSKVSSIGPSIVWETSSTRLLLSKVVSCWGKPSFGLPSKVSGDISWVSVSFITFSAGWMIFSSEGKPVSLICNSSGGIKSGLASDCILFIVSWSNAWAIFTLFTSVISGLSLKKPSFS